MATDTVIIGLGVTGFACAEYLHALNIPFTIMDSRENPPQLAAFKTIYPNIPVYTGGFVSDILSKAHSIILSPGIAKTHPDLNCVSQDAEIIGDIELFARAVGSKKPIVAITGSNGKSTVTTLVGEMAKASGIRAGVGGNLGTPALALLDKNPDLYVLELSSFQLETTDSLKPTVATILNICPDHMDRYPNIEAYILAKSRIFNRSHSIVINRNDPLTLQYLPKNIPTLSFGIDVSLENQYGLIQHNNTWLARGNTLLLPTTELKLFGRHNAANVLAALALGESIGLPMDIMLSTVQSFKGLPHRCEWVREYKGVHWINDSKGTNVGASLSAIQGLSGDISGKWVLIAGGLGKNADFTPLKAAVRQHCAAVVLLGEASDELHRLFKDIVPSIQVKTLEEAVTIAARETKTGDGVLLSPACASWDMFKDFAERGDLFKKAVLAL